MWLLALLAFVLCPALFGVIAIVFGVSVAFKGFFEHLRSSSPLVVLAWVVVTFILSFVYDFAAFNGEFTSDGTVWWIGAALLSTYLVYVVGWARASKGPGTPP